MQTAQFEVGGSDRFLSNEVDYIFCNECGHLNGVYEDTEEFITSLHINDGGIEYAKNHLDKSPEKRTRDIYLPKSRFLIDNVSEGQFTVLDVGCGAGYFFAACKLYDVAAEGLDVSESMVRFGNTQLFHLTGSRDALTATSE